MRGRHLAILALICSTIIWGAAAPIFKWSLENIPLFSLAFLRFGIATFIILPFVFRKLAIDAGDWGKVLRIGLWGVTLNVFFFLAGLKFTLAINAAIITAVIPIFTMVAATVLLKEKITTNLIFSSMVALLGVVVLFGQSLFQQGISFHFFGNLLLMLSAWAWVGYEVDSKKLFAKYSPIVLTFYTFLVGAHTFLPFAVAEFLTNPTWPQHLEFKGLFGIAYGAVLSSAAAYFLWQWGLSKISATEASLFFHLNPISGILVSVILLGEQLTIPFIIGSLLIFSAVAVAEYPRYRRQLV